MKKLLLFLTLLFASHAAHGAKISEQAEDNLWYSFVNPSQCNPQNMSSQQALDACKEEDPLFSFDTFILKTVFQVNPENTLLHNAIIEENIEQVQFIFEHITDNTKSTLAFRVNQKKETPFILALQKDDKAIINYMLTHVNDQIRNSLLCEALKAQNTPLIILILEHKSFNPNFNLSFQYLSNCIKKSVNEPQSNFEDITFSQYDANQKDPSFTYSLTIDPCDDPISRALILLIRNNKCTSETLAMMLFTLLTEIHKVKGNLNLKEAYEINNDNQYYGLINAILTNKNFDKDDALKCFIRECNLPAIEWLFTKFPGYQDDGYINVLIQSNVIEQDELNIIEFLINHGITNISPKHYNDLTNETSDLNVSFDLDQLTINSWNRGRSLSLKTIGIAAILYDFIKFKKPEKVVDEKKDSKAKITEKPGIKKDTKKAAIKQDKKESKEKQKRSLLKRLAKHTRNYVKDLKNLRNHKKLAIPVACLLFRFLKDKTSLKWY